MHFKEGGFKANYSIVFPQRILGPLPKRSGKVNANSVVAFEKIPVHCIF